MFTAIFAERNSIDNPTNLLYLPFEEIRNLLSHALEIGIILVTDRMGHTLPQMVLKADLGRRIGTLTEWENPIQKSLDLIGRSHVWIGAKIETAILFDLARDDEARIALISNLDEGIGLVVLEHDIVFGLVLLDEFDLKKQGLNIGLGDDKLKIHNLRYQRFRLEIGRAHV